MERKLIIDGNAVYELDEECMLKRKQEAKKEEETLSAYVNRQAEERAQHRQQTDRIQKR